MRPPLRLMDFETIVLEVCGAVCTILAPVSWCWPSPAKAIDRASPLAWGPMSRQAGYFMLAFEPMLPSIHSIVPPSATVARWVTRL